MPHALSVKLLAFKNTPYPPAVREKIFELFKPERATVDKLGYMNFLLGEYFALAALAVIKEAGAEAKENCSSRMFILTQRFLNARAVIL